MIERWILVADDVFAEALERVQAGDSPGAVLAEVWANAFHTTDTDEIEEQMLARNHLDGGGAVVFTLEGDS